ncbi:hypothetical protein [Nocardia sp. alder85J]|uniref:hypothetical protein n=1 Tax=Nocardia sp. alder85J TaxID=2862949 RepID=UPI001CD70592|nr:hypothetical protein [Nocardia sp. alder85J]MCX4094064.1 hypothetical protein [Nocardia sp. alder85J]
MSLPPPGWNAPPPPARPAAAGWEVAVSVCLLVLALLGCGLTGATGLFLFAFTDVCPPDRCSPDHAFYALAAAVLVAGLLLVCGTVVTVVRMRRGRTAWPIAVAVAAGCLALCAAGLTGEAVALGF